MECSSEETSATAALVIDGGSDTTRAGFSDQSTPECVIPTVVGRVRHRACMVGMNQKDCYVGEEAQNKSDILHLKYPINNGVVCDWDDMEKVYFTIFYNELQVAPEEHAVLLSEPPLNPLCNREKMAEIMFETFGVPSLFVANQGVLSLRATGRNTGVVVDCGHTVSQVIPVHQGQVVQKAVRRIDMGGCDITQYLLQLLAQRGYSLTGSVPAATKTARDIKEKLSCVALDFDAMLITAENSTEIDRSYKLSCGQAISIGSERFQCSELWFQPDLAGRETSGLDDEVYTSIIRCDVDIQMELCSNIVLSGGATLCEGFADRLQKSIQQRAPSAWNVKVIAEPERKYSTWIGGSCSVDQVDWITRRERHLFSTKQL